MRPPGGWRARTAWTLAGTAVLVALLMVAPMPTYGLWLAHFVAIELSLGGAVLALGAILLAPRRALLAAALPAMIVCLLPLAAALEAAWRSGARLSIPEWVRGPAAPAVAVEKDLVLDPALADLPVDVYHAPGAGPHPFVVVVHGGSWRHGDKGAGAHVSRLLAAAGHTVIDVRYRLAPEHPFPAAVEDVKCLLGMLRRQAERLRLDPSRAVLLGRSAGGQIALLAACSAGDPRLRPRCDVPDLPVQGVVAIYAVTDMAWGYDNPVRPDVVRGPESLRKYLGGTPSTAPDAYELASPLTFAGGAPPVLLVHGTMDRMVRPAHSRLMHDALLAAGRASRLLMLPFAEHGFDMRPGGFGEQVARAEILRFIASPS